MDVSCKDVETAPYRQSCLDGVALRFVSITLLTSVGQKYPKRGHLCAEKRIYVFFYI